MRAEGRPGPEETEARRLVLGLIPDLIVGVRVEEAAKGLGVDFVSAGSLEEAAGVLREGRATLLVVDLGIPGLDLEAVGEAAREQGSAVVALYPHVDSELRSRARAAGLERVYPRSRFMSQTSKILREALHM